MLCMVDLETTGLNPARDSILEIAMLAVTNDLEVKAAFEMLVGPLPLDSFMMDEVVQKMHQGSGLLADVRRMACSLAAASAAALAFARDNFPKGEVPLCGNSIHFDRGFLRAHMPSVEEHFHYRNLDITSIREAAHRWSPKLNENSLAPAGRHRAMSDLQDSLALLRFYKTNVFEAIA